MIQSISIHAPTRGATISNGLCDGFYAIFQSTLPREERQVADLSLVSVNDFNPRSHERSDLSKLPLSGRTRAFQSTLPREERPCEPIEFLKRYCISIHAPTRGATVNGNTNLCTIFISIHAPTRGATGVYYV